jgi:hypothetical protein
MSRASSCLSAPRDYTACGSTTTRWTSAESEEPALGRRTQPGRELHPVMSRDSASRSCAPATQGSQAGIGQRRSCRIQCVDLRTSRSLASNAYWLGPALTHVSEKSTCSGFNR